MRDKIAIRDKIAQRIRKHVNRITELGSPYHSQEDLGRIDALHHKEDLYAADQILTLIRGEIEKVENPYTEVGGSNYEGLFWQGFEASRQKILKALKI